MLQCAVNLFDFDLVACGHGDCGFFLPGLAFIAGPEFEIYNHVSSDLECMLFPCVIHSDHRKCGRILAGLTR